MGQKKPREKTADELQSERVIAALEETDRTGKAPAFVRDNPGQFLREMYEVWHRQGGKEGGRWRNSIRKMRDEWLVGRNAVPSLHPKLMGRVKLTRSDARALIDLFLERWHYGEDDDALRSTTREGYAGFAAKDRKHLRRLLLASLFKANEHGSRLHLPAQSDEIDSVAETERRWINVEKLVHECAALITLSRHKIAVGPSPWQTIGNVWHMLNHLFEYDQEHGSTERLLIWVVDLGSREVEQTDAFEEYFNAGLLALQLASFANFDTVKDRKDFLGVSSLPRLTIGESVRRQELWQWLLERVVVIVQNLRLEEVSTFHGDEDERLRAVRLKDFGVTAEHILPSATPGAWIRELRHLYGKEISASDATFTIFMRDEPWRVDEQMRSIRYFAHTPLQQGRNGGRGALASAEWVTRSEELKTPDRNYDHASRLVYWAARHRLKRTDPDTGEMGWEALAYLRKIGFRVLSLPAFLKIFSTEN